MRVGLATAEEQEQRVVAVLLVRRARLGVHRFFANAPSGIATAGVEQPPRRDRRQPRARVAWRVIGPHPKRLH